MGDEGQDPRLLARTLRGEDPQTTLVNPLTQLRDPFPDQPAHRLRADLGEQPQGCSETENSAEIEAPRLEARRVVAQFEVQGEVLLSYNFV